MPTPTSDDVLVIVDVQNDFLPGGALAVTDGDAIIAPINALARRFANVLLTQDWHPADHVSFASNHPGRQPFEVIALDYGPQVLWPDHCVWNTPGAALSSGLDIPHGQLIIRKGFRRGVDSYSAFREADRKTTTGLDGYLEERGQLMVSPGEAIYEGMIVGENAKQEDLEVNPLKSKQLTNFRASGKDEALRLTPPLRLSLEQAIAYVDEDELVEVTPRSIRLRKRFLDPHERKKASRATAAAA